MTLDEPMPQKCCGCGDKSPLVGHDYDGFFVACQQCRIRGPLKPTRPEAIQAWNSIMLRDQAPRQKTIFLDQDPLAEEWLRKVGLWDGLAGDWPNIELYLCSAGVVFRFSKSPSLTKVTTCKTIGEARQLCRLLGVPLRETLEPGGGGR